MSPTIPRQAELNIFTTVPFVAMRYGFVAEGELSRIRAAFFHRGLFLAADDTGVDGDRFDVFA